LNSEIDYGLALVFGALFGLSELITRYKDEPGEALQTLPSALYILINASVSCAALFIAKIFGWTFGVTGEADSDKVRIVQLLVSAFSSMALLRSSLFTVRIGNQDVGIGFSAVVQSLLRTTDYAVDRKRAMSRDTIVKIMERVSFEKAAAVLPAYCLGLMQNLSPADQQTFARDIDAISKLKADNTTKSRLLGLAVINVMGTKVLICAVESLGDKIAVPPPR